MDTLDEFHFLISDYETTTNLLHAAKTSGERTFWQERQRNVAVAIADSLLAHAATVTFDAPDSAEPLYTITVRPKQATGNFGKHSIVVYEEDATHWFASELDANGKPANQPSIWPKSAWQQVIASDGPR